MYSLVLMAAMTTAPDSTGFGGSWYNHCTLDSCLPIRYGWKPYGCVMHTPIHVPYGCYGCYGCGGCYGHWHGCYGCGGCYGYGLGYWHADQSSYGAGYAGFGAYGNYGHFGSYSLYPSGASTLNLTPSVIQPSTLPNPGGSIVPNMPSTITPSGPSTVPTPYDPLSPRKQIREIGPLTGNETTTANIIVEVPEGAIVYIDGNKMKSTAARRVFTTPPIEKGQDYFYTVRVVIDENGRKIEDSQKVLVRGGEETAASFAYLKKNDGNALVGR